MTNEKEEKEWETFKEEWKGFKERFTKVLEAFLEFNKSIEKILKGNVELWHYFLRKLTWILSLVLIISFRKEISDLIILIWNYLSHLSENWRIALFQALWSLLLIFIGVVIGKKWQKSSKKKF